MDTSQKIVFAPHLYIRNGVTDITFYTKAFGAIELRRFSNDDGTVHVAEFDIQGSIFHLHEEVLTSGCISPEKYKGITCSIGMFVQDVDAVIARALTAGAFLKSPAQDYDYGYRQAIIVDPFGHDWLIEAKI